MPPCPASRASGGRRWTLAAPALALILVAARGAAAAPAAESDLACKELEVTAERVDCSATACALTGDVRLQCESLSLWADTVDLELRPDGGFGGASARGNVLLVDGPRVVSCESIALDADTVRARMEDAVVEVKKPGAAAGADGRPSGRNRAEFSGRWVERESENRLHIDDAVFTLCDCGDAPPSWRFTASSIDATLGERVTIWWPVFWISPFGLDLLVPVTPPMPPLSLPLASRAAGMLAPRLGFFDFPWPMIDLPVFIPLGRSWDLTVTPGLRTDWTDEHSLTPPSSWGAFRLGARLRYAPARGTEGSSSVDWTYDRQHAAARARDLDADALTHRVALSSTHRSDFSDSLRLLASVEWLSDDLYLQDFGIGVSERAADYVPSRAQLHWRTPVVSARLGADYLLRLRNTPTPTNLQRGEYDAPQHGPALAVSLVPLALGGGLHLTADASFDAYAPWSRAEAKEAPAVTVSRLAPGLVFARDVGPVAVSARGSFDAGVVTASNRDGSPLESLAVTADASASMRLVRSYGSLLHVVTPRIAYRALPWRSGPSLDELTYDLDGTVSLAAIDERLRRDDTLHQALVALEQTVLRPGGGRIATLELSQPVDLASGELLASRLVLDASVPGVVGAAAQAGVYLPDLGTDAGLRELTASVYSGDRWPIRARVDYVRFSPRASRFQRSIYEIEAPADAALAGASWIHFLAPRVSLRWRPRLEATYSTAYYLEYPDAPASARFGFTEHAVSLTYRSPCDCWAVQLGLAVPHDVRDAAGEGDGRFGSEELGELRFRLNFEIGGYALGT